MATKVGGFTKSGVVQCVKLVEEGTSSKLSSFNGTFSSSNVTCNNGFVITGYKDGTTISTDFDNIRAPLGNIIFMINPTGSSQRALFKIYGDVVNGDVATASLEPELWAGSSAEYLPTNSSDWTSNENFEISQIIIQSTGGNMINQYVPVLNRIHLSFNGQSVMYEKYAGSNPQTYYYNPTDTKFILYAKDRVTYSTVSISKSGVLKCSKLIEEAVTPDASKWNATLSDATLTFNNGYRLEYRQGASYETATLKTTDPSYLSSMSMWIMPTGGYYLKIAREGTTNHFIASFQDSGSELGEKADTLWRSDSLLGMYPDMTFVTENASGGYDKSWFITTPHTYAFLYNADNTLVSIYEFTSGDMDTIYGTAVISNIIIPQKDRVIYPTVRIFKDGTIKCAEVEEATVTQIPWTQSLVKTSGLQQYTFNNGYVLSVKDASTNEVVEYADDGSGFVMQFLYEITTPSSSPTDLMAQFVTYSGSKNFTTTFDFYNTSKNINYIYFSAKPSTDSYIELVDSKGTLIGKLSGSGSGYRVVQSDDKAIQIPLFDLVSYSWPGSTIVKATNTFITSDNKNFLTNTGDQFMVR